MGDYTTLKFTGIVKKEYRDAIDKVMTYEDDSTCGFVHDVCGKWLSTGVDFMMEFAKIPRAIFIPNFEDNDIWDKETGYWSFETELKNYKGTYSEFFKIMPLFIETVEKCMTKFEYDDTYTIYANVNGVILPVGEIDAYEEDSIIDSYCREIKQTYLITENNAKEKRHEN